MTSAGDIGVPVLKALPPALARIWRQAMPEAMAQLHDELLRRRANSSGIIVIVADRRSVMAPALQPSLARERPSNTRAAEMPIVRVLVDDDNNADDDPLHVTIRSFAQSLPEGNVVLLVVDGEDRLVLTALPLAPAQRYRRGSRWATLRRLG